MAIILAAVGANIEETDRGFGPVWIVSDFACRRSVTIPADTGRRLLDDYRRRWPASDYVSAIQHIIASA